MKPEEKAKLQEELQQVQQKRAVEMQAVDMENKHTLMLRLNRM